MRVIRSVVVPRPPQQVFRWIDDPERALRWQPGVAGYRVIENTPGRVGTRFVEIMQSSDGLVEMEGKVVAYEPGRMIAFALAGHGTAVGTRFEVLPHAQGSSVAASVELVIPGLLARVLGPFIQRRVGRQVDQELGLLRELVEDEEPEI